MAMLPPNQPAPPTVNAQGYEQPGLFGRLRAMLSGLSQPGSPQQQAPAGLQDALRQRMQAQTNASAAQDQAKQYGMIGQNAAKQGFSVDAGAGTPREVDWGNIIQAGVGNFMQARKSKEAQQETNSAADFSQQFAENVFQNDPQGRQLMQLAQAGIPGADKALAEHLSPKKEALGSLTQLIQSGQGTPEFAQAIAQQYFPGMDPQLVFGAAKNAAAQKVKDREALQQQKLGEIVLTNDLGTKRDLAVADAKGDNKPALTPTETGARLKSMEANTATLNSIGATEARLQELNSMANDQNSAVGAWQRAAASVAKSGIPIVEDIASNFQNEFFSKLEATVNEMAAGKTQLLRGPASDRDVALMLKTLPNAQRDPQVLKDLLKQAMDFTKTQRVAAQLQNIDINSGRNLELGTDLVDYYQLAKDGGEGAVAKRQAENQQRLDQRRSSGRSASSAPQVDMSAVPEDINSFIESIPGLE
jgi:hypothetical protein